jgi:DNA-binding CsgD family transcriptional regulator
MKQSEMSRFVHVLNDAVHSVEQWRDVLAALCAASGARKAIIALRDNKTAGLVIPDHVSREFFSPLLYGFSEEEVESYVTRYIALDPWTEIERRRRPIIPYSLSAYLPRARLKASPFWEWLEGQGISDTCVAELECGKHGWVALNVYFDGEDRATRATVETFMRKAAPAIARSWRVFQQIQKYRDGVAISPRFMAAFAQPALVFDHLFDVIAVNDDGAARFPAYVGDEGRLGAGPMPAALRDAVRALLCERASGMSDARGERLVVRPIQRDEDFVGRKLDIWLATLEAASADAAPPTRQLWENEALTVREREAVNAAADGLSMSAFANKVGISLNTAKSYLRDARRKLGGLSTKEIYARAKRR